jgi:tetratricopeptide (TPR) repeat protein
MDTGLGGQNSITGTVVTAGGGRYEVHVPVRLVTPSRGDRVATTDDYGNFAFRGITPGDYTITVDTEKDFETFTLPVSVIQIRGAPGQNYIISVRLLHKGERAGRPSVISADLAKVPKHAMESYNKGVALGKNGDQKSAIEQLQNAVTEYPQFMDAYNEMGVQYLKLKDVQKADEAFQSALNIDPKAYGPLMNRGMLLVAMKNYVDAEPLLRQAVQIKNDQAVGHYFLGQAVAYQGKFDEGKKELRTAIELGGDSMKEAHRLLAIVDSATGDKKGVADELETYLKLVPNTPDADNLREVIKKNRAPDKP